MPGLRRAAFGLLLFVGVLGLSLASCATAGVRYVIMALDTNGAYPRTTFYTDSVQIVCVSKVSVGDPDTTLDVIIRQTSAVDWDDNPISGNPMTPVPPQHPLFSATELMPEVGSEETEAVTLLATGTGNAVPCLGYCTVDPPPSYGDPCRAGYTYQGLDTCGFGAACCFNAFAMPAQTSTQSSIPYPAGTYECDVSLNGVSAGSAPFTIEYACDSDSNVTGVDACCPTLPPTGGIPCRYFVPKGTTCAGFASGETCVCNEYVWECSQ